MDATSHESASAPMASQRGSQLGAGRKDFIRLLGCRSKEHPPILSRSRNQLTLGHQVSVCLWLLTNLSNSLHHPLPSSPSPSSPITIVTITIITITIIITIAILHRQYPTP
jgi:hypothetical protein